MFHILAITKTKYKYQASVPGGAEEAYRAMVQIRQNVARTWPLVLRDGVTGKRYSLYEAGNLAGYTTFDVIMHCNPYI